MQTVRVVLEHEEQHPSHRAAVEPWRRRLALRPGPCSAGLRRSSAYGQASWTEHQFRNIEEYKDRFVIEPICRQLQVAPFQLLGAESAGARSRVGFHPASAAWPTVLEDPAGLAGELPCLRGRKV